MTVVAAYILEVIISSCSRGLTRNTQIHDHNTRFAKNFNLSSHRKTLFEKKPFQAGARYFNSLPVEFIMLPPPKLKPHLKQWLSLRPFVGKTGNRPSTPKCTINPITIRQPLPPCTAYKMTTGETVTDFFENNIESYLKNLGIQPAPYLGNGNLTHTILPEDDYEINEDTGRVSQTPLNTKLNHTIISELDQTDMHDIGRASQTPLHKNLNHTILSQDDQTPMQDSSSSER
ncbi:hypothetical protein J6590_070098 [Homalodisca vitripennis]|nr:hypothetical protein J6590_070098 [Homalodisca vitripennis]